MLDGLVQYMTTLDGVSFEPLCDVADRWRNANPLEETGDRGIGAGRGRRQASDIESLPNERTT